MDKQGSLKDDINAAKQPRIDFISLEKNSDYDFFPEMEQSSYKTQEKKLVGQLKNGSYRPFMQMVEYEAKIKGTKYKKLEEAHPASNEYKASRDNYEQLDAAEMVKLQKRMKTKSRLEVIMNQFQNPQLPMRPRYYHNPLQYFDHVLLSDQYVNGFPGNVIDTYADFIMPKSLKPVLRLHNPENVGTKEEQQKMIKENQDIISTIEGVDNWYSDLGAHATDSFMDIPLQMKWKAQIINFLTFGRDALVYENWDHIDPVTVNGKEYKGLPNVTKLLHPIDMGMLEIDEYSWKLGGMYVHNDRSFVQSKQMLYMVNQYQSPFIGSMLYGYSKIQRAIDPGRLLRRILAQNYQQYIRSSYAGMGMFMFDSTGYPEDVRTKIRTALKNSWKAGELGVIDYANIKDLKFEAMNINADIGGLQSLQEQLIKVIIGVMGVPQSLIFDEAAATRATLVGRIVSFINNQITTLRQSITSQISAQWYNPVYRTIYEKDDRLNTFYIDCEFEEQELETKLEKVARLLQEQQLNPYTDEYIGEELGDKDYIDHIDEKKKQMQEEQSQQQGPGGSGGAPFGKSKGQFSVTDSSTGQQVKVSQD